MAASNRVVIRIVIGALLVCAAGCKRDSAAVEASMAVAAETRAALAHILVEENRGWDPGFVARRARAEIDACREAIELRLGLGSSGARHVLEVHYVHDSDAVQSMMSLIPGSEQVLRYGSTAFLHPSSSRLVFARDAEVPERTYMISLALLLIQYEIDRVWLADAVAIWLSDLAMNRLQGEPLWVRGRVRYELGLADVRDLGPRQLEGLCRWSVKRLPMEADLTWDMAQMEYSDIDLDGRFPGINAVARLRILTWVVVYGLASFDVGDDGCVRFGGTPKYDAELKNLVVMKDAVLRDSFCGAFAHQGTLASDLGAYRKFARRKLSLGQHRNGILIAWDQYTNSKGRKTGQPDDDLLLPR